MRLSPREQESLLVHQCGALAQKRLARGLRLNHPEAVALIASQIQEYIREGYTVSELMSKGKEMLGVRQVLPGVPDMIGEVQVEGTFPDGTKLVTVHTPICRKDGNLETALYGSFLPVPSLSVFDRPLRQDADSEKDQDVVKAPLDIKPGERLPKEGKVEINKGRKKITLQVVSKCDRPIQVGSHFHFIETNKRLVFDRLAAYGYRLNVPAGTSIRFEPGEERSVDLVEIAGNRIVRGGNNICDGEVSTTNQSAVAKRIDSLRFGNLKQAVVKPADSFYLTNRQYGYLYGPTTGDKMRLGDMSLILEVEKDFTVYGDELQFGGGKTIREGMGQQANRSNQEWDVLDTVITNALIVDAVTGIIKADIGIKNGMISSIGKAGNPDSMANVTPLELLKTRSDHSDPMDSKGMVVGSGTEAIAGEGMIVTAGGLDAHVHFICAQLAREAVASGLTTMFGGGTGPATGTNATTCTPGPSHIRDMLQSTDGFPLNFGFTGKGNSTRTDGLALGLEEQVKAGAIGLKLHEDWGTTPAAIDSCLRVAEKYDVQVTIHTDTLNESACVEESIEAFKGRTIHAYHSEGAGGGHAPDIIRVCSEPNVLPSSTNPTRPYTANTIDEHLDMLMVCHHLDKNIKNDVSFAESRIRAETIAAEDILHDMGAISIMASDSQAMGRVGEVITRTWQTADKMKLFRGQLPDEKGDNDNLRIKRYMAKYTINPAKAHGMDKVIGSIEPGKLADIVIWHPAFFGAKPEIIIKGGQIAWAQMGMPNASIPTPEPVKQRKMFGAYGKSVGAHSVAFISQASVDRVRTYGLSKKLVPVAGCRNLKKTDMILNNYLPKLTVDPYSYQVHVITEKNGKEEKEHLTCPPSSRLPLAQRYFLF